MRNFLNKTLKKRENTEKMQQVPQNSEIQESTPKITLLNTTEGAVFIAGVAIALAYTIWLGSKFIFYPDKAQMLAAITTFVIIFGRATGLALGYTLQFKPATLIAICMILESVQVLIFYPLFVFSWRHLLVIKSLKRFFDKLQNAAITHQDKVRKYGIIGLFAFVFFPFWMTGPMVGCVIGFMMALPVWLNLSAVLSGTYVAILCWAFILHSFHEKVAQDSPFVAMILMMILVIIVIIGVFLSKFRQNIKKRNSNGL